MTTLPAIPSDRPHSPAAAPPERRLVVHWAVDILSWKFRTASIALSMLGGYVLGKPLDAPLPVMMLTGAVVLLAFVLLDLMQARVAAREWARAAMIAPLFALAFAWNIYSDFAGARLGVALFADRGKAEETRQVAATDGAQALGEALERDRAAEQRAGVALATMQADIAQVTSVRVAAPATAQERRDHALAVRALQGRVGARPDGVIGEETGARIDGLLADLRSREAELLAAQERAADRRRESEAAYRAALADVESTAARSVATVAAAEQSETERELLPIYITLMIEAAASLLRWVAGTTVEVSPKPVAARRRLFRARPPAWDETDLSAARPPVRPERLAVLESRASDAWRQPAPEIPHDLTEAAALSATADRRESERRSAPVVESSASLLARTLQRAGVRPVQYEAEALRDPEAALKIRKESGA